MTATFSAYVRQGTTASDRYSFRICLPRHHGLRPLHYNFRILAAALSGLSFVSCRAKDRGLSAPKMPASPPPCRAKDRGLSAPKMPAYWRPRYLAYLLFLKDFSIRFLITISAYWRPRYLAYPLFLTDIAKHFSLC